MKKMSKLSMKIVLPSILAVLFGIVLTAVVILSIYTGEYFSLSSDYISSLTNNYARQIESQMEITLNTAETESLAIKSIMERPDVTREEVLRLVHTVLDNHEELVGIGVGFEPNAFDGKDSQYTEGTNHSDENGRFVPYTYRENGIIDYTLLDGYDDPGEYGSWYNVPKQTNQSYVTNPYWYEVGSEKYLMFTCVAPLRDQQGEFIGITGFDTPVAVLNGIVENAKVFDTGYLSLIAPDGTIAYHQDSVVMGSAMTEYFPSKVVDAISDTYSQGKGTELDIAPLGSTKKSRYTMEPIEVGLSGGQWIVLTVVPLREINKTSYSSIRTTIIIGILIAVLIAVLLNTVLSATVLRPVKLIKSATDKMASGSLSIQIPVKSKDEFGQLAENLEMTSKKLLSYVNHISKTLGEISNGNMTVTVDLDYTGDFAPIRTAMEQITTYLNKALWQLSVAADRVSIGAEQVADGSQNLAHGTVEQTSAIEELSTSIGEIMEKTNQSADMAREASGLSGTIRQTAEKGSQKMGDMMRAVSEINDASQSIYQVIKTINDIAFQTNILSLNAAIEAARAGQHGKGFTVVAEEVRNLAAKSAEAAKDTGILIEDTIEKATLGLSIATETSDSLLEIVDGISRSTEIISLMAKLSEEQADSVTQFNMSIEQVMNVVQNNNATAEESSSASEEMSAQSLLMQKLVNQFKIQDDKG